MNPVEKNIGTISKLFKQHKVEKATLFGSILTDRFDKGSDIDMLVQFGKVNPPDYFDNYLELKEQLEKLLGRKIDLVEEKTIKNPVLLRSINNNSQLIYGRTN